MSDWNPEKYLMFKKQRTQPAIDLATRLREYAPHTVVDIGCGPGNSTAILKSVFPDARIFGIDNSESMIAKAKQEHGDIDFVMCGAEELSGKYDLLFSNACLQWIPNHETLIPHLMNNLCEKGTLAVQMPMNSEEPLYRIIKDVTSDAKWNFENTMHETNDVLSPEAYFDILSDCSSRFEMWETVYYHVMPSHEHLIDWVRSTRLRPYLNILNEKEKRDFEAEILCKVKKIYPLTETKEVILRFRRLFFIAHK